jgi:hypothetical protein
MPLIDAYAESVLADGPVGYWRLNERTHDERVIDESGRNHHGRFIGRPTLGEQGAIHGSPNCSMSFAPQAHIEIPHSPNFSIQTSGKGLSVEVWMRPDLLLFQGEGGKQYIHWLGKGELAQSKHEKDRMEWGFRLYSSDHPERPKRISAYAWNPQGGEGAGAYHDGKLVAEDQWLHLVACFQHYVDPCVRKTGVQLYVNGEFAQGPPSSGTHYFNEGSWSVLPRGGDAPLRIATRSATANSFLTGGIDEVAIYPKVLTPEQIKRHFDVGTGK